MRLVQASWEAVDAVFTDLGFVAVELDPNGYRRGGLLAITRRTAR
jgi:PP-loop superfamily ATP-utilizing enzyme